MNVRYFLIIGIFSLFSSSLQAQTEQARGIFRDLRRLEGVWFMPTDRGDRLEIWSVADDSTMNGRSVRIKAENGDTVTLETLRLERRDTTITYYATARGQNNNKPVAFDLTEAGYGEFVFENPKHDDPQIIKYVMLGNRELQVTTEGRRNGRPTQQEYVFEREFNPTSVEFRLRFGANAHSLRREGAYNNFPDGKPEFGPRPGWELGLQTAFKGRGGFLSVNAELSVTGVYSHVQSFFYTPAADSVLRNGVNTSAWVNLALCPEITFRRDGKLSLLVGPYFAYRIYGRQHGDAIGATQGVLFSSSDDLKKRNFGLHAGFQYKLKAEKSGKLGLRMNWGLSDLDNLYRRRCTDPNSAFCSGSVVLRGISLYYSFNLLDL